MSYRDDRCAPMVACQMLHRSDIIGMSPASLGWIPAQRAISPQGFSVMTFHALLPFQRPARHVIEFGTKSLVISALLLAPIHGADVADGTGALVVGGTFTALGTPRLSVLNPTTGFQMGAPLPVDGVLVVVHSSTHTYLGGSFTHIDGQSRRGLARLNADGKLDPTWHPDVTGEVLAMALQDELLVIGGRFTAVGGVNHGNLAQIKLQDGNVTDWSANTDGAVQSLAITEGGILVGGSFLTINGQDHVRLARLDLLTGATDEAFVAAADAEVRALAPVGNQVVVGGLFNRIGSQDRHALALLDSRTGAVEPNWRPDVNGVVMALDANKSRVIAGGAFDTVNGLPRANGVVISLTDGSIADGKLDTDGAIMGLSLDEAGRCHVAGEFTTLNDKPTGPVGRVETVTWTVDTTWKPGLDHGQATTISAHHGRVVAGISKIDGELRTGIAGLDLNGATTSWRPALEGPQPRILCGVTHGSYVYLGGDFSGIAGARHQYLARFYKANGSLDDAWHGDANGSVTCLSLVGDLLYIGGDFTQVRGIAASHLATMSLKDGAVSGQSTPINGTIHAVLPTPEGTYIAGNFTSIGGVASPGLALLRPTGALRETPNLALSLGDGPGMGYALERLPENGVAIGGSFTGIGGTSAENMALLDGRGALRSAPGANGPVYTFLTLEGDLVLGGGFTTVGGKPRGRLARMTVQGQVTEWHADANLDVRALARQGEHVWVGGDFTRLADLSANRLGRVSVTQGQAIPTLGTDDRVSALIPTPP